MASEPLTGKRHVEVTERKTKKDWAIFIRQIADDWYKDAPKITLVMDNLSTHKPAALYEAIEPKEFSEPLTLIMVINSYLEEIKKGGKVQFLEPFPSSSP